MADGDNEFRETPPPADRERVSHPPDNGFSFAVDRIQQGNAQALISMDPGISLGQLRDLDPGLPGTFFGKARSFLGKAMDIAGDSSMSDEERVSHLSSIFFSEVNPEYENRLLTSPVYLQIMNLGAFAFVGERHEMSSQGPKEPQSEEITAFVQEIAETRLSKRERDLLTALAAGMEIGHREQAVGKFGNLMASVHSHVDQRTQVPEEIGQDFTEALLITQV